MPIYSYNVESKLKNCGHGITEIIAYAKKWRHTVLSSFALIQTGTVSEAAPPPSPLPRPLRNASPAVKILEGNDPKSRE